MYSFVRKNVTVLLSTSLAWPAWAVQCTSCRQKTSRCTVTESTQFLTYSLAAVSCGIDWFDFLRSGFFRVSLGFRLSPFRSSLLFPAFRPLLLKKVAWILASCATPSFSLPLYLCVCECVSDLFPPEPFLLDPPDLTGDAVLAV